MSQLSHSFFLQILQMEGGYQNFQNDNGNYACGNQVGTNRGVSAIAYQQYTSRCPTVADMQAINDTFAEQFYQWYFSRFRLGEIDDQDTANLLMNNFMGAPKYAAQAAQKAMNQFGYGLAVDGQIGSKTIAAINDAIRQNKAAAYNALRDTWIAHLQTVVDWAGALTTRVNRWFPAMATAEVVTIKAGSTEYQGQRVRQVFKGALHGDPQDLLAIFGSLFAITLTGFAIFKFYTAR